MSEKPGKLDFAQRSREKDAARDIDSRDLASGKRSAEEINAANNMFACLGPHGLRNARLIIPEKE